MISSDTQTNLYSVEEVNRRFYPEPYCTFVKQSPSVCFEESFLELWAKDGEFDSDAEDRIMNLTQNAIIEAINSKGYSGIFMREKDFKTVLGEIGYNASGHIVEAKVATLTFVGKVNQSALNEFGSAQRGDVVDRQTFEFEGKMAEEATNRKKLKPGTKISVNINRMLFESLEGQVFKDIGMLALGYVIVFIYVLFMLGKCNWMGQKFFLSIGGIFGIIMGIIAGYGVCSICGLFYSAAHTVLPFLLLGIGIDDMFVIVQCLNNLPGKID